MVNVLASGVGGFLGHHLLAHLLEQTDWDIAATDSFRHKGRADRIALVLAANPDWARRVTVITHDLAAPFTQPMTDRLGPVDYIVANASQSHVDRSIEDPVPFVRNNIDVALNTLELARQVQPRALILVSTDEVYGPTEPGSAGHPEWVGCIPSNPYAASKVAQEALAISYWRSYGVPAVIINSMNMIGERQSSEKFLPKTIRHVLAGETVPVHGTPGNIGTRHYVHVRDVADAILFILRDLPAPARFPQADRPDRYNITGHKVSNLEMAQLVADICGLPLHYELVDFHSARPGHDPHYGLEPGKLAGLGWKPPGSFRESLERTVRWQMANPEWMADD